MAFGLVCAPQASAVVLDWNGVVWTPGSLNNSYDLNGDPATDITVKITSQTPNIWQPDPAGTPTPAINQTLTGGLPEKSLMIAANLHTNSNATVQISFTGGPGGLLGANNVSFTLFDIDLSADRDIISNIYGVAPDGSQIPATITNIGSAVSLTGIGLGQTLTGNLVSPDSSANGNATISFGSTLIYDVFFTFGNSSGPPRYQDIAIGDISFTPVPEVNPAVASVGSCLLAAGMMVFVHRRRKVKTGDSDSARS
jgi:hypothetical protein